MTVRKLVETLENYMIQGKLTGEETVFDAAMFAMDIVEIHGADLGEDFVRLTSEQYDEVQFMVEV